MKKINVLIMTYNQQEVIGRAVESILVQRQYGLNKIIISDDCSTDNNVEVINNYVEQYPDIIELHVNERNLGIYGNSEKLLSIRGDADLFHYMAGDDAICEGWFRSVQEFICDNEVEIDGVPVVFYSDWKMISPNGEESYFSQKIISQKKCNPMSLQIRGLISIRSTLWSRELLNLYEPVDLSHGVSRAETMFDIQPALHSKANYYIPIVASIYYSEIGFSQKTHSKQYEEEVLYNKNQMLLSYGWGGKDIAYLKYSICRSQLRIKASFLKFMQAFYYYVVSIDSRYPRKVSTVKLFGSIFKKTFFELNK